MRRLQKAGRALPLFAFSLLLAAGAWAQDDFGGWANDPNNEPGTDDQLFDRTDSGNVAQSAQFSYSAGLRELKTAAKLEAKLDGLEGKKHASTVEKIAKAYSRAESSFLDAVRTNPGLVEAYVGLGQAFRAQGKSTEAMQVSASGLKVAPDNDELFGTWAGALLDLNMLGDATQAYTTLKDENAARAQILMSEMKSWLKTRMLDPGDLDPEAVSRLAEWIREQEG